LLIFKHWFEIRTWQICRSARLESHVQAFKSAISNAATAFWAVVLPPKMQFLDAIASPNKLEAKQHLQAFQVKCSQSFSLSSSKEVCTLNVSFGVLWILPVVIVSFVIAMALICFSLVTFVLYSCSSAHSFHNHQSCRRVHGNREIKKKRCGSTSSNSSWMRTWDRRLALLRNSFFFCDLDYILQILKLDSFLGITSITWQISSMYSIVS